MRSILVAAILVLALSGPAAAQEAPASLWEPAGAGPGSGSASEGGRSTLLVALALLAFAGAGGLLVLAVRPRAIVTSAEPRGGEDAAPAAPPLRRPRPVAGPPPLPAFGPGSHDAASAAPPPPET